MLAGCATPQAERFYTLTTPDTSIRPAMPGAYVVSLGTARIPEVLDRPQLVLSTENGELLLPESQRWAESLREAIPHAIAESMRATLETAIVAQAGDHASIGAKYRILLDVTRFDTVLGQRVNLEINWTVVTPDGTRTVHKYGASEAVSGKDYVDLVHAHAHLLATLGAEIACALNAREKSPALASDAACSASSGPAK